MRAPRRETFSYRVKSELTRQRPASDGEAWAELLGLVRSMGALRLLGQGRVAMEMRSEHPGVARRAFTLLKDPAQVRAQVLIRQTNKLGPHQVYVVVAPPVESLRRALERLGVINPLTTAREAFAELTRTKATKRAFLRGLFLGAGSLADPEKAHHLEIVLSNPDVAEAAAHLMARFKLKPGRADRKGGIGLYFKDMDSITEFLRVIGASRALFEYEDVRIFKEVKNQVNRQVNAETANLRKTADAAARQIEAIEALVSSRGWDALPPGLRAVAMARLADPDLNLRELGQRLVPPLSKSGVSHRLRELQRQAELLRAEGRSSSNSPQLP